MTFALKKLTQVAALIGSLLMPWAAAQAQTQADPHHPAEAGQGETQPPTTGTAGGATMGQGMPGAGMMGPGMMRMMEMMHGSTMGMMGGCPMLGEGSSPHSEGRVAFLKAELGITDAQKAVWDDYAKALKQNFSSMQMGGQPMMGMMGAGSPVEKLDARLAMMEGRVTALKALKVPLTALYSALSPEQKATADRLLTSMGCMM